MIIVQLAGGLGNQMFQYAFGRSLSHKFNIRFKADIESWFNSDKLWRPSERKYSLDIFKLSVEKASKNEILIFKSLKNISKYLEIQKLQLNKFLPFTYLEEGQLKTSEIKVASRNIYVTGYWQSEKYFSSIQQILLNDFQFRYEQTSINKALSREIISNNSISLHIRRGDYISDSQTNNIMAPCTLEYYYTCIKELEKKFSDLHFYIFSDDIKWAEENLEIDHPVKYVDFNIGNYAFEDMRLMSQCKHNIIANSSFSWWGAWLNKNPEKIVIAPQKWFNDPILNSQASDIVPESWMRL